MQRVVVTGASGFIGSWLIPVLQQAGYEVHAASRGPLKVQGAVEHHVDLLAEGSAAALFRDIRADFLVHVAWYAEHGKFWQAPENADWLRASLSLIEAFFLASGRRVLGVGTCAEYDWSQGHCTEYETRETPGNLYGLSKLAAGHCAQAIAQRYGASLAWARLFFPYGPREAPKRLIPYAITQLLQGEPALCTNGLALRDFIHVEDVARALVSVMEAEVTGPVNIASGESISIASVLQEIGIAMERPDLIRLGAINESQPSAPQVTACTNRLIQCGWTPRWQFKEGLHNTIDWWREARLEKM
ncbi:MAG: NAD-dependent epimerase/dehydratase [Rhodocyclales bacterium]|nr:NAD-dependent epimerase/dehydratase [Rhodocyclales bacterium]